jgi:hypothetical protein
MLLTLYFCLKTFERGELMIFLLTWDGALKWRFLFFLREEVTILLNFILKACKLSRLANNRKTCPQFWLRLLILFYLYFMHFWAIQTRKYQTNFMISLYWCDLYCISINVTGLFFKRPEYTFDVYLRHIFFYNYTARPGSPIACIKYTIYIMF